MFGKKQIDVLVIGAGPIGMATALQLVRRGVRVAIIDKATNTCTRSNALALAPSSLKTLDRLGIARPLLENAFRIERVVVYDEAQARETVRLNELDIAFPYAAVVSQSKLEDTLEKELRQAGVSIHWNHRADTLEQTATGVSVTVQRITEQSVGYAVSRTERMVDREIELDARLLIAADGYDSLIAKRVEAGHHVMGDPKRFVFFDFETDILPDREMRVSITADMAVAEYPMPGGMSRLAFEFDGISLPEDFRAKERELLPARFDQDSMLGDQRLRQLIETRAPWEVGYINRVLWRGAAEFPLCMVDCPLVGRVLLMGDAARNFGPVGMTSTNLGLLEGARVAEVVGKYLRLPELCEKLGTLAGEFKADWETLYALQDRSMPIELADPWVTAHRGCILESMPVVGESLERLSSQLFIHLNLPQMADA